MSIHDMTADLGDDWGDMNDWGSEDWERWKLENRYPELRHRFDPSDLADDDFDVDGSLDDLLLEA